MFEEWETSPLSRSIHSPAFRASLDAFLASSAGKDKALCFRCHAPHVREFPDQAQLFIDQAKAGDPSLDGVACAQCHLIKQVDRTKQPPEPKYELGSKTLYGPYKDFVQNLAHQSMELGLFQKSDLCLNCHQSVPLGCQLGKANDLLGNWDQSKAMKSGKECQSCHMPEQVGESANGEKKRKVANHTFPGRIGKLRQEAAKLDVQTKIEGEKTTVTVKVQSLVPHNLPTTHPAWATVVLDLDIKGKNLKTVFTDKRVYGRVYADAKGQKTIFDFEAVKVLEDTVLKPEETRVETFTFPTPKETKTFDVEVTLNYAPIYRSCPVPAARRSRVLQRIARSRLSADRDRQVQREYPGSSKRRKTRVDVEKGRRSVRRRSPLARRALRATESWSYSAMMLEPGDFILKI